jgi:hydrogenase large subunit
MSEYAKKRKVSPGVLIDGELVTQDLVEINVGVQEMVEHSYFDDWEGKLVDKDPLGNTLTISPMEQTNKTKTWSLQQMGWKIQLGNLSQMARLEE